MPLVGLYQWGPIFFSKITGEARQTFFLVDDDTYKGRNWFFSFFYYYCIYHLICFVRTIQLMRGCNLSVDSNPNCRNIGPDNTMCDAAATPEGCSEVSNQFLRKLIHWPTRRRNNGWCQGSNLKKLQGVLITPTMETMKLAKNFPIPFPVAKFLPFTE